MSAILFRLQYENAPIQKVCRDNNETTTHMTYMQGVYFTMYKVYQGPFLLTWFNFNPSMYK